MSENENDWQGPPTSEISDVKVKETPEMSLGSTLGNIFLEPGAVFEDIRKKPFPRLVIPLILCAVLVSLFSYALTMKVGKEQIVREQLKAPIMENVPEDAKKKMIEDAKTVSPIKDVLTSSIGAIAFIIIFAIMGLIYWGLSLAFGGTGNYWHGLAVAAYSSFPITVVSMLGSLLILFLKNSEDISFFQSQQGLLRINPNMLVDAGGALGQVLGRIDLLVIWGVVLGTIGLIKCFRLSSGSAWAISILFWLIGTGFAALMGMFQG